MLESVMLAMMLVAGPGGESSSSTDSGYLLINHCLVSLIDQSEVSAQEAGVLQGVEAKAGLQVAAGDKLAQIDDSLVQTAQRIAGNELSKAQELLKNDIEVRYARAAARVAETEYMRSMEANRKQFGSVVQAEIRRQLLAYRRAELSIEKAEFDRVTAKFDALTRQAEMDEAQINIKRRQIVAPIDGVVVEVHKHVGEWVHPGDPVLKIIGLDRLRVEGFISAAQIGPQDVDGRPVHVRVTLEGGREEVFTGKIVFTNPVIEGGEYRVWAEVTNRKQKDKWILSPGHEVEMAVELDDPTRAPRLPVAEKPQEGRGPVR